MASVKTTLGRAAVFFAHGLSAQEAWKVERIKTPAAPESSVPRLSTSDKHSALLSWMEPEGNGLAFRFARWQSNAWTAPKTIAAGPDLLAAVSSEPNVLELPNGTLVAEWLTKSLNRDANEISVATSRDAGTTWSHPVFPYRNSTPGEHMYVSLFPWPAGGAGIVWLDPRNRKTTSLVQTTINDAGVLGPETVVSSDVCDCCPTSSAVLRGSPAILYRSRTTTNIRDMYLARYKDGKVQAGDRIYADNWQIDGCPTNAGSLVSTGDRLAASWFTAADQKSRVELAFLNKDSSKTPLIIDEHKPAGRVSLAALPDKSVVVAWLARGEKGQVLRARQAWPNGRLGAPFDITAVPSNEKIGFPFSASVPGGALVVWTRWLGDHAVGLEAVRLAKESRP